MQRELDRLVRRGGLCEPRGIGGGYPPVNVLQSAGEIIVECEVPGVPRENLDISITGETLVVRGGKPPAAGEGDGSAPRYQLRERGSGDFSRTIVLPDKVDAATVTATLANGILTVRLPKSEPATARQIEIQ
jgi:HSP20 family protein